MTTYTVRIPKDARTGRFQTAEQRARPVGEILLAHEVEKRRRTEMGLDVNLYAQGVVTDDEFERGVSFFRERELRGTPVRSRWESNRIEIDMNGARFWGPGYERGPWPEIALNIMATVAAFPNCTVHYGSDSLDEAQIIDDDRMAEMWGHFFGPRWNDYRSRVEARP